MTMKRCLWINISVAMLATFINGSALNAAETGSGATRRAGPPGGTGADSPRGPGQRMMQGQQRGGGFPFEMILDEDQRGQVREEMMGQRDKLRQIDEKSAKLRRELDDAMFADKLDEKLVREKHAALAEFEAERSLMRARVFAKVRPSLSNEQLERLKDMRAQMSRGNRPGEGGIRPPGADQPPQGERPGQPRPPRGPEGGGPDDVLPPPSPPKAGPAVR